MFQQLQGKSANTGGERPKFTNTRKVVDTLATQDGEEAGHRTVTVMTVPKQNVRTVVEGD